MYSSSAIVYDLKEFSGTHLGNDTWSNAFERPHLLLLDSKRLDRESRQTTSQVMRKQVALFNRVLT